MSESLSNQSQPKPAVTDLSQKVVSLARTIDRLPPGTYTVTIVKTEAPAAWGVRIDAVQTVRQMEIGKP